MNYSKKCLYIFSCDPMQLPLIICAVTLLLMVMNSVILVQLGHILILIGVAIETVPTGAVQSAGK